MRLKILIRLWLLAVLAVSALAQGPRGMQAQPLRAAIPFAFRAGDKILPPGQYDFVYNLSARWGINLRVVATDGSANVLVLALTRLPGAIHTTPKDAHIVFDKVADTYFLSSLWLPNAEGYLVRVTMENVEHTVVDVPR